MTKPAAVRHAARPVLEHWLAVLLAAAWLPAQTPAKDDDEVLKAGPKDPYTAGDEAAMRKVGIVSYGPFAWADHLTTANVDKALGEHRVLWVETAHFKIGCALKSIGLPSELPRKRAILDELASLHARLPAIADKPKKLDPWLRAHLFAQRAERLYAEFQQLLGVTDADFPRTGERPGQGPFLGQQDKFLLLLLHKKSDLARYFERCTDVRKEESSRHLHTKTWQMVAAICCEGFENFDDPALHRYTTYMLLHNLCSGYRGFYYTLPLWFDEGLAHWYARRVESDFVPIGQKTGEAINREKLNLWHQKVRQRLEHEEMVIPFATASAWSKYEELGLQEHMQSWSRVDWLMSRGAAEVGTFLEQMKSLPPLVGDKPIDKTTIDARQTQLLQQLWQLDAEAFDRQWRAWVQKTYPKK